MSALAKLDQLSKLLKLENPKYFVLGWKKCFMNTGVTRWQRSGMINLWLNLNICIQQSISFLILKFNSIIYQVMKCVKSTILEWRNKDSKVYFIGKFLFKHVYLASASLRLRYLCVVFARAKRKGQCEEKTRICYF